MSGVLSRVGAFFLEGVEAPPRRPTPPAPGPTAASRTAAVLGSPAVVVPVAAACAGELRARERAPAALLCLWRPAGDMPPEADPEAPAARSPAGATTPGARRLAGRLAGQDLAATACGRLAWLGLDPEPAAAARELGRAVATAEAPLVLAVAGARPAALEPILADLDLGVVVLPSDAEGSLRELALAALPMPTRVVLPPLPPGPARWAAMAGLARLRSLPAVER